MNSIDTSTTAGKIAVMQASNDGKAIECSLNGEWSFICNSVIGWHWDCVDYRIKPQTLEEAAKDYTHKHQLEGSELMGQKHFKAGAQWQKKQMINDIILEQDTDNE